jgi:hypothetical protein
MTRHEMMVDKYLKIKVGLTVAREFAPTWLMRAGADDLISRRLVHFIEKHSMTDHGDNWSGPLLTNLPSRRWRIRKIFNTRPIGPLRDEFGMARPALRLRPLLRDRRLWGVADQT